MKIIFMGTPQMAVTSLLKIFHDSRHDVIAVVTNTDKQQGRGRKFKISPVKSASLEINLPILQPHDLKDELFLSKVKTLKPDIFVVVAFRILPDELIAIPQYGAVNLHASLLPKYRGAAPIQWALINGEKSTGVTVMQIDSGIDTGGILLQKEVSILPEENAGELSNRLSKIGTDLIIDALNGIESGTIIRTKQDSSQSTKAPKITPDLMKIDWSESSETIVNLIRGLTPDTAPFVKYKDMRLKIHRARIVSDMSETEKPGTIIKADPKNGLLVTTGTGVVEIASVQREGKRIMAAADFLRGAQLEIGKIMQ